MRVYITGIAGFVGSHLASAFLEDGHEVAGCDNLIGGELTNVPAGARFDQVDCRDLAGMKRALAGVQVLYHCAATAYEGLSVFSPTFVSDNVFTASVATFTAALSQGVGHIVYCSSMARYGDGELPFREEAVAAPRDPYGICKVAAEAMLENLCRHHKAPYVIAVPHNIYGPRQRYDDPYRNVAAIMTNLMLQGKPAIIYGDGRQKRCFSYVDDCIQCLVQMGRRGDLSGEIINIGPDEEFVEIKQLAGILAELTGFSGPPRFVPDRPAEVKLANCSSAKARRLLRFRPRVSLRQGLASLVDYIRERGPRPFRYHIPLELDLGTAPATWRNRLL